uniref:Uncharacterized protein n=1 Tax=Avena sativa TaxID=4498 RepID=A0ACD6A7U9_AVESA
MALPDVILEEIFLRLPPDEPESLVRASLASKLWLGRLTGAAFHGRYREFHGDPPMLGFLFSSSWGNDRVPKLASTTTKFCGRIPPDDGWAGLKYDTRECRHGRVLLVGKKLTVWNPMTGRRSVVDTPGKSWSTTAAAVLCGVAGCDHSVCHDGTFRVVLVDVDRGVARACVSSPETVGWSKPCRGLELGDASLASPSVLVRDGLYYKFTYFPGNDVYILKYDLTSDCLSAFEAPAGAGIADQCMLMAMQDCSLGFASLSHDSILHYWSRQMLGSDGGGSAAASSSSWTQRGSIHLKSFLPVQIHTKLLMLMGSAEGSDIVFVITGPGFTTDHDGIYQINLNSLHWKKIWKEEGFVNLLPYMSFYHPRGVLEQARSAM